MLDELFREIQKDIERLQKPRKKVPLGLISESLKDEYADWHDRKEELDEEIAFKANLLKKRMERELTKEFSDRLESMSNEKMVLWKRIQNQLSISDDLELNINVKTGVVSEWKDEE